MTMEDPDGRSSKLKPFEVGVQNWILNAGRSSLGGSLTWDRVSDPIRTLCAAHKIKPPALPWDTDFDFFA